MFDGAFSIWHLLIVAVVFVALFGYKRLPDASKNLARSLRIFKSEMKNFHEDETPANPATQQVPSLPAPPAAAPTTTTPTEPVAADRAQTS
ncbi:MAG TPA: Sec-independent protein translocase subunit TatA [Mycobacteriales bacterium]|jgi:sec-independent protein translocase protein TatA|nr:Sec-independent protein translocase subunit TatA [Mycobacteriales bacterium]